MKVADIIKLAKAEVGYSENPANSNNTKYGEWYGLNGQPWCVIFLQYLFRGSNLLKRTASSTTLYNWFKNNKKAMKTPQMGDIVFFNFDKNPQSGVCKHVGLVLEVGSTYIKTIEGNTATTENGSQDNGGIVAIKTRYYGKSIVGYGRVDYDESRYPTLKRGSQGSDVIFLQQRLASSGFSVGKIDGIFGGNTEKAVKEFQHTAFPNTPKEWDGIVGTKTWEKIIKGV